MVVKEGIESLKRIGGVRVTVSKTTDFLNLVDYRLTGSVKTGWAPGTVPPTTAKRAVSMENVSRD